MKTNKTASVANTMSAPVVTCRPQDDAATVAKLMWDHDCGFIPVVGPEGNVVGVITDRDICMATMTRRLLPEHLSAAQVMSTPVYTCLAADSLSDALAAMKQFSIRRLVVVDRSGHPRGVLSMNDIVRASQRTQQPSPKDVVATLATVCEPRSIVVATG
jgi:CBS domain-containing protein